MIQKMRGPGIEPGSTAWKAAMLTIAPATLLAKDPRSRSRTSDLEISIASSHSFPAVNSLDVIWLEEMLEMAVSSWNWKCCRQLEIAV